MLVGMMNVSSGSQLRIVLAFSVLWLVPMDLVAQPVSQTSGAPLEAHARVAVTMLLSADTAASVGKDALPPPRFLPDSTGMTAREKRVLKHTLWGTVAGFAAGMVAATQIHTGCDTSSGSCGSSDGKRNFLLGFGGVGALLGASVGTVVGLVREIGR